MPEQGFLERLILTLLSLRRFQAKQRRSRTCASRRASATCGWATSASTAPWAWPTGASCSTAPSTRPWSSPQNSAAAITKWPREPTWRCFWRNLLATCLPWLPGPCPRRSCCLAGGLLPRWRPCSRSRSSCRAIVRWLSSTAKWGGWASSHVFPPHPPWYGVNNSPNPPPPWYVLKFLPLPTPVRWRLCTPYQWKC